jgi:hypothetical protein
LVFVAMLTGMAHLHGAPSRRHAPVQHWSSPEPVRHWSRPERVELGDTRIPVRTVRSRHVRREASDRDIIGKAAPEVPSEFIVGYVDPVRRSAAFHRLTNVNEGDRVKVVRSDHSIAWFKVDSVRRAVRRSIEQERSSGGRPELRLISWRGAARRDGHADPRNVIVSAHLDHPSGTSGKGDTDGVTDE